MPDHRPDLHGHVEVSWRTAEPPQAVIDHALAIECPDCNVNVFVSETPVDGVFLAAVAHDDTCPWFAQLPEV